MTVKYPQWQMWSAALDDETCDRWIEICRKRKPQDAKTFRTGDIDDANNMGTRKTIVRWINEEDDSKEIFDSLKSFLNTANEKLQVKMDYLPPLQFTEYADVGHHYDTHHDIDWNRQDGKHRKLSIVVQLTDPSEYSGGVFNFEHTENPDPNELMKRGSVLVFYSYLDHSVSPITNGARTSMVAWVEGPRWV